MAKNNKELKLRLPEETEEAVEVTTVEPEKDFDAMIAEIAGLEEVEDTTVEVEKSPEPIKVEPATVAVKEEKKNPFIQYTLEPDMVTVLLRKTKLNCTIGKQRYNFIKGETMRVNRNVERILKEAELI